MTRAIHSGTGKIAFVVIAAACGISIPVYRLAGTSADGRHVHVAADIRTLSSQLAAARLKNGFYPASISRLKDPWGRDYFYVHPGRTRSGGCDLFSTGPDGLDYTADDEWGE